MSGRIAGRIATRLAVGLVSFNVFLHGFQYYYMWPLSPRPDPSFSNIEPSRTERAELDPLKRFRDPCLTRPTSDLDDLVISDELRKGKGPPYNLSRSPGKGMGLFATEFIPRGAKILEEKPVLTCPTLDGHHDPEHNSRYLLGFVAQVFSLSPQLQRGVFSLKGERASVPAHPMRRFREVLEQASHPDGSGLSWRESLRLQDALRIFYTNAAAMYEGSSTWWFWRPVKLGDGLFLTFSRMNHSCEPNATWDTDRTGRSGIMSVWAEKDIRKDEEITISYIRVSGRSVETRRQILRGWGFECQCEKCGSLPDAK